MNNHEISFEVNGDDVLNASQLDSLAPEHIENILNSLARCGVIQQVINEALSDVAYPYLIEHGLIEED